MTAEISPRKAAPDRRRSGGYAGLPGGRAFAGLCMLGWALGLGFRFYQTEGGLAVVLRWKITQYYINFAEFGFARRALVGSIFKPLIEGFELGVEQVMIAALVLDFFVVLVLAIGLARLLGAVLPAGPGGGREGFWLGLVLIVAPVGFVQIGYDAGRFDHLNFVLFGLAVLAVFRARPGLGGGLMAIAVLNHEAAFVYAFPVLAALAIGRFAGLASRARLIVPPVLAAGLVLLFGNISAAELAVIPEAARGGVQAFARGLLDLPRQLSLSDAPLLAFYTVSPYWLLLQFYHANGRRPDLLFLASLAALALFVLGYDYPRWGHLVFVSVLAVLLIQMSRGMRVWPGGRWVRMVALLFLLPLGPIGTTLPLPLLRV